MEFPSGIYLDGSKEERGTEEEEESLKIIQESSSSASTSSSASSSLTSPPVNDTRENFLPIIKTEIKKMGVEISDERAEQLKNDVRRLSPDVVSLRERTLGEISLTSDSSFFDGDNPETEPKDAGESGPEIGKREPENGGGADKSSTTGPEPSFDLSSKLHDAAVALKCDDEFSGNSVDDVLVEIDSRTADDNDEEILNDSLVEEEEEEEDDDDDDGDGIVVPLVHDQSAISSSPAKSVIQKLAEDEEIVFGGEENVAHVQLQSSSSSSSSSSPSLNTISFIIAYPEASPQSCSSIGENQEQDPLRETEEAEDSDSSERSSSQNNVVNASEIRSENSGSDNLPSCLSTARQIAAGIDTEQFTEDSAESLALATGNRDEVRSDGSDSGLGGEISTELHGVQGPAQESDSETSFLDRIPDDILAGDKEKSASGQPDEFAAVPEDADSLGSCRTERPALPTTPASRSPPKSNLKRRLTDCMEGSPHPKRINNPDESQKKKRNIHFDAVTVYYFPRAQGFTCVPSQGGSTLGMSAAHTHAERFSLTEHAAEQRRIHRARLAQLRSERAANNVVEAASSSEDPSDDTDEEPSDADELDIDSYYFLLPVPTWQRRALLRAAGVQKIDTVEKDECRDIRASRKHCGCGCKGYCDPESCPCSRAHVKCQVDRAGFPCGCSRDGCANSSGRIEFNPVRVRTHFIHTLMRLELEKKHREEDCPESQPVPALQGPLRGLPLPPNSDSSSCGVNGGGFTTLHYPNPPELGASPSSSSCQPDIPGAREDSLDLYAIRDDCYPSGEDPADGPNHHHHQRKQLLHPPEFGQQNFQPQFQQQTGYQDYQSYQQTLPSTSRAEFHHPQYHQTGFGHYAGYGGDDGVSQHPQTLYEQGYLSSQEDGASGTSEYTNLNSVQIGNESAVVTAAHSSSHHQPVVGKLEPFSELLAGRYSYYGEIEPDQAHVVSGYPSSGAPAKGEGDKVSIDEAEPIVGGAGDRSIIATGDDCDDNFGEIIKKSMVETVSA